MTSRITDTFKNVDYPYTCAFVNNQVVDLTYEVESNEKIELLPYSSTEGKRTFERSIVFLAKVALKEIDSHLKFTVKNSIQDSLYCAITGEYWERILEQLKQKMLTLVQENHPIRKYELPKESAMRMLEKEGRYEDVSGIKYLLEDTIPIYELKGVFNYFAGPLVPSTKYLRTFDIAPCEDGIFIMLPRSDNPFEVSSLPQRPKLLESYRESSSWSQKMEISNVADINRSIITGKIGNVIKVQEALHEMKIADIARQIVDKNCKLVLIAGPSSAGKTTFSKRLEVQLKVHGFRPFVISTDNYFINRDRTPLDEEGNPDFENPRALNIDDFQQDVKKLLEGDEVEVPRFNFITGKSEKWKRVRLTNNGILVVEGIHALNPSITERIPDSTKFKVYVSVLTQINIDNINRIPTRDHRLIRRIVRDTHYRGISAKDTIKRWHKVAEGEEKYIFPYQETADAIFNSSVIYGLPILRVYAEAPLRAIEPTEREYAESLRLLKFLSHFIPLLPDEVPQNSILREFIGKSSFKY